MVETIVPVVHGTRTWIGSLLAFLAGTLATAAALGLALGWVLPAGGRPALAAAAAVAALYALREAGLVRVPVPALRRQVPVRWRERHPPLVTALLYGAGLGLGFVTYLPVATLVAVSAGVVLVAGPLGGAVVLAAFGLGRALVLAVSTAGVRSYERATGRVELMAGWSERGLLRRTNAVALAVLAGVLAVAAGTAPAAAATRIALGSDHVADPSLGDGDVLAFDRVVNGTLRGELFRDGAVRDLPGTHPDVDGDRVVVDAGREFQILDVASGTLIRTVRTIGADPALSGRWLVYRTRHPDRQRIVLYDLQKSRARVIAAVRPTADLGAPDVSGLRVVYTLTRSRSTALRLYRIDTARTRVLREATRASFAFASVSGAVVAFVMQNLDGQRFLRLNMANDSTAILHYEPRGTRHHLWTVDVRGWRFVFTRYSADGSAIFRV